MDLNHRPPACGLIPGGRIESTKYKQNNLFQDVMLFFPIPI